ncbi:MAG: SoxR reducing system RseC family protein [Bacteroidota bacterium]
MEKLDPYHLNIADKNFINHFGEVSKISKTAITVSLDSNIHCNTCKAKSACNVSNSNAKKIEVKNTFQSFTLNEKVNVIMQKELGLKAVFFAYVLPFIIMFFTLIVTSIYLRELIAGLVSIFVLIPYYIILYFLRNSFVNQFKISIVKNG